MYPNLSQRQTHRFSATIPQEGEGMCFEILCIRHSDRLNLNLNYIGKQTNATLKVSFLPNPPGSSVCNYSINLICVSFNGERAIIKNRAVRQSHYLTEGKHPCLENFPGRHNSILHTFSVVVGAKKLFIVETTILIRHTHTPTQLYLPNFQFVVTH